MKNLVIIGLTLTMTVMLLAGCAPKKTPAPSATPSTTVDAQTPTAATSDITGDQAKTIALQHAGLAEKDVFEMKIEKGTENGYTVYEVSFKCNGKEYDYDIDNHTGTIIKSNIDIDD